MTVSISDMGVPKRTNPQTATVTINVIRNSCPFFTNLPDDLSLTTSQSTQTAVYTVNAFDNDPEVCLLKHPAVHAKKVTYTI